MRHKASDCRHGGDIDSPGCPTRLKSNYSRAASCDAPRNENANSLARRKPNPWNADFFHLFPFVHRRSCPRCGAVLVISVMRVKIGFGIMSLGNTNQVYFSRRVCSRNIRRLFSRENFCNEYEFILFLILFNRFLFLQLFISRV